MTILIYDCFLLKNKLKRIQAPNPSHFRRIRGVFFGQTIRILASWIFCLVLNSSVNGEKGYYSVLRQQSMCYVPVPVSPTKS